MFIHYRQHFQPVRNGYSYSALTLAVLGAMCQGVSAQTAQQQDAALPTVVVTGQAASIRNALDVQQAADNVVSAVKSDDIGQLPDKNAAEALQRLPGVSVERDQGEGRYVRVRGLGPDFNSATINGSLVPAPEADRRAVALDVLPSSLIRSIEVVKTLTPDMDANSLGGTVKVQTMSAFDHKGPYLSMEAGLNYASNTSRTAPNLALAWSDVFMDGALGIAAGFSHDVRKFGSDNVEGAEWDSGTELTEFERRDYKITRERTGMVLNFDYRPVAGENYYLRTLFSRFSDDEVRQSHKIEAAENDDGDVVPLTSGVAGDVEASRRLKARKETQKITSIVLGGDRKLGDWGVSAALGLSRASEDTPKHIASAEFEGLDTFSNVGFTNTRSPRLFGDNAINEAAAYVFKEAELSESSTEDKEINLRLDLSRKVDLLGYRTDLKFGGKISRRHKTSDENTWVLDRDDLAASDEDLALSNFTSGGVDYDFGTFGPAISPSALRKLIGNNASYQEADSRINDYDMKENIDAAYVQTTMSMGDWRVLTGVRWEGTRFHAEGTGVQDDVFATTKASQSYRDWLPAIHVRRDLDDDTTVRAAWTKSVVRPNFGQLAPGFQIEDDEAEFGNPNLKPLRSNNFDLGIERRLGESSVVSAYGFYKRINNFAYRTDLAGTGAWEDFDEAVTYANGQKANLYGVELAYAHAFKELPAPFNGLLASANVTFTKSEASISAYDSDAGSQVSRHISLPSQSDRTLNVTVGYEAAGWNLRLAANYKSDYLYEVQDVKDKAKDLYVKGQTQIDFSAAYALTKQVQLVFEAMNLNDSKYYVYAGDRSLNAQYESYGPSYRLGLRAILF